jgi:hypothetical protein
MHYWEKLRHKWGLKNHAELVWIMVIFAITGFTVLFVKDPVFQWLGYHRIAPGFWKVLAYIGIMYPLYQIWLLIVGSVFGRFSFFSRFLLKMNLRIAALFKSKRKK